jgi:preprotein translocase subunit YajC
MSSRKRTLLALLIIASTIAGIGGFSVIADKNTWIGHVIRTPSVFAAGGNSCFSGNTLVTLADGTSKAIEDVREGDRVLGFDGRVNTVVAIESPFLDFRKLYSINGSGYFVTAEHPIMTTEGWKSINPKATRAENPNIYIEQLMVGDMLVTESGLVSVFSIEAQYADPRMKVYNLVLDKDPFFYANGFGVMGDYVLFEYEYDVPNE